MTRRTVYLHIGDLAALVRYCITDAKSSADHEGTRVRIEYDDDFALDRLRDRCQARRLTLRDEEGRAV